MHITGLVVMLGGSRVDEFSISLLSRIVAVAKLTILVAQRAYRHYSACYVAAREGELTSKCRSETIC
jgi:hypothetical protein